jgi:aspartate/methionine/tyrosine aminotransferase
MVRIELTYGSLWGTPELLDACAGFLNCFFSPSGFPIQGAEILATNGVTAAIDLMAWTLCEPGDAILFPAPTFYMLDYDLVSRSGAVGIPVTTNNIRDPFAGGDEDIDSLIQALADAADVSSEKGHRPRVLFICNPSNPHGRCYSRAMLEAMLAFCAKRSMHLVADEIYAMSQLGSRKSFTSVLALPDNSQGRTDVQQMVHCLYGLSKDFDMGGLRMGFVVSRNKDFISALQRVAYVWFFFFFWDSFLGSIKTMHITSTLLTPQKEETHLSPNSHSTP